VTLDRAIEKNAAFAPAKTAIRFEGAQTSYAALSERIARAAGALAALGVGRGDRVAHLGLNAPDMLVLLYACARTGAMLVPINWRLATPEMAYIVGHAAPKVIVIETDFADRIAEIAASVPGFVAVGLDGTVDGRDFDGLVRAAPPGERRGEAADPVLLVYTSGTTGRPKGAVLTQAALAANAQNSVHMHGLTAVDHVLTVLPMFHVGGLNIQTTPALHAGATVTLHRRFVAADTLSAIATDRPTLSVLVPATMQALMAEAGFATADLSSLRVLTTGSTIVPERLVDAFARRGVKVVQVYGSTETAPVAVYERFDVPRTGADHTGLPGLLTDLAILDADGRPVGPGAEGEIAVRGPNVFTGYWNDPEATAAVLSDGWFATGDIGVTDGAGRLTVRDRKKNLIISGGENIYPAEIERVIADFPGVAECAVVGRPDPRWQETPVAFVVAKPGTRLDVAALEGHLERNLARFKLPREILLRESLPRNAMGKAQHFVLKRELIDAATRSA